MFVTTALLRRIARLEARVTAQDEAIRSLCAAVGVEPPETDPAEAVDDTERDLIAGGRIVQAIKHHREHTGSSLIDAKRAIDQATPRN